MTSSGGVEGCMSIRHQIRAVFDERCIVVYQAYSDAIAKAAPATEAATMRRSADFMLLSPLKKPAAIDGAAAAQDTLRPCELVKWSDQFSKLHCSKTIGDYP